MAAADTKNKFKFLSSIWILMVFLQIKLNWGYISAATFSILLALGNGLGYCVLFVTFQAVL